MFLIKQQGVIHTTSPTWCELKLQECVGVCFVNRGSFTRTSMHLRVGLILAHTPPQPNKFDVHIDYIRSRHTNSKLLISMVRHCICLRARPSQCIFKFGIVPKVLFLGGPLRTLDLSSKDLSYMKATYFGFSWVALPLGHPPLGSTSLTWHIKVEPQSFH